MKKQSVPMRILSLLFALVLTIGLCACPAGDPVGGTTGTSGTSGTTTGNNPNQNPGEVTDAIYPDGAAIDGAGATLPEDCFALTVHTPNEANAIEVKNIGTLFRGKVEQGATYLLTADEFSKLSASGRTNEGEGAIVIAPHGVVFDGATDYTLQNITVIGAVTVKGNCSVTLSQVDIQNPNGTALTVEEGATVRVDDSRISGKIALESAAASAAITNSTLFFTEAGIKDNGTGATHIVDCILTGEGTGISLASPDSTVRENTFELTKDSVGIALSEGAINTLIALNVVKTAQQSLVLEKAYNASVVLNQVITVVANNNTSIYICDNSFGGRLCAEGNNYFLADGNTFPEGDGLDHSTLQANNQNTNGDTLMDVDARLEAGADENLLPHINLDLFIGMERKETVTDYANGSFNLEAGDYILAYAKTNNAVILAPGRYADTHTMEFTSAHSDTTVYAYGAYLERVYEEGISSLGLRIRAQGVNKLTVKGMTVGYERQSCGQVYVLAKEQELGEYRLTVVTGAGMDNEFGNTNPKLYDVTAMGAQREGTFFAYCDTYFDTITKRNDGLMTMRVNRAVYEMIEKGDILTCRATDGNVTFITNNSTDVLYKDVNVYGAAAGFAFNENNNRTATTYYRVINTTKSGPIIDEATYNWYKALEEEYGVSTEVYVDGLGRYRGSLPHIGSVDATHTISCAQGSVAISCIFENMCDDATNQRHNHGRLASIVDNGDGTSTVTYRGNWSVFSRGAGLATFRYCEDFRVGDRVFIYTAAGQLVCDGAALSNTVRTGRTDLDDVMAEWFQTHECTNLGGAQPSNSHMSYEYYEVTVKTEDVNMSALNGYDLRAEGADDSQRVLIDNMSMASNGFTFDNCRIQNIRSRGLLIKASGGVIKNCTFRNIGMACAAILYEIYWGESGVSENITVTRNLIDHTGFFTKYTTGNENRYSPISIEGLGSRVDEDYLLYKNIAITHNVILNRRTEYAIYINSARDVIITDNSFGDYAEGESDEHFSRAIHINGAMNIEISRNTYSSLGLTVQDYIIAEHNKNIFGTDVVFDGTPVIPDGE